jgi:hypothetical protein
LAFAWGEDVDRSCFIVLEQYTSGMGACQVFFCIFKPLFSTGIAKTTPIQADEIYITNFFKEVCTESFALFPHNFPHLAWKN